MISCMHFVKQGEFKDALAADLLQHHPHDLIAVAGFSREIGKEGRTTFNRLSPLAKMPRLCYGYAIERFEEETESLLNSMI